MRELFSSLLEWYLGALDQGGYLLVAALMAMESSIIPLPSEFVIPPAAYLAHAHGKMSLTGIVVAGTIGSWVGASLMYWASRLLGRPLLMRYGRYVLITEEKIQRAEAWSGHFGTMGVFVSRLLPVIRHLIGIPAGIVRLNFWWYSLATIAGSALWCAVLAWVGYEYLVIQIILAFVVLELILTGVGASILLKSNEARPSNVFGKIKMILQSVALLLFLIAEFLDLSTLRTISLYLLWLALALAVLSGGKQIYDLVTRPPKRATEGGEGSQPADRPQTVDKP